MAKVIEVHDSSGKGSFVIGKTTLAERYRDVTGRWIRWRHVTFVSLRKGLKTYSSFPLHGAEYTIYTISADLTPRTLRIGCKRFTRDARRAILKAARIRDVKVDVKGKKEKR